MMTSHPQPDEHGEGLAAETHPGAGAKVSKDAKADVETASVEAILQRLDEELKSARQESEQEREEILKRRDGFWGRLFGRISV